LGIALAPQRKTGTDPPFGGLNPAVAPNLNLALNLARYHPRCDANLEKSLLSEREQEQDLRARARTLH
jgi:hypothetical protein